MKVILNGQEREFPELGDEATLSDLILILGLKEDRVAVEHNGSIVARGTWGSAPIHPGDKFEIVHFVGGGSH
jgi:thiamine biosynthesis protein ThiS